MPAQELRLQLSGPISDPVGPGGSHLRQRQTMCGSGARGFRSAEELPQLPRLPLAGCTMEGPPVGQLELKEFSSNGLLKIGSFGTFLKTWWLE